MALQKVKENNYGVVADYWSVGGISLKKDGTKSVNLNLHVSKEAKDLGKSLVDNVVISNLNCNCEIPVGAVDLQDAILMVIYTQIKEQAILEADKVDGGPDLSFFSDAIDV